MSRDRERERERERQDDLPLYTFPKVPDPIVCISSTSLACMSVTPFTLSACVSVCALVRSGAEGAGAAGTAAGSTRCCWPEGRKKTVRKMAWKAQGQTHACANSYERLGSKCTRRHTD